MSRPQSLACCRIAPGWPVGQCWKLRCAEHAKVYSCSSMHYAVPALLYQASIMHGRADSWSWLYSDKALSDKAKAGCRPLACALIVCLADCHRQAWRLRASSKAMGRASCLPSRIAGLTAHGAHCRFGWHSLVAAYGVPKDKLTFIPHGVVLPQSPKPSASRRHLLQSITLSMALQGASVAKKAAQGEHPAAYTCRIFGTVTSAGDCRPSFLWRVEAV